MPKRLGQMDWELWKCFQNIQKYELFTSFNLQTAVLYLTLAEMLVHWADI